jgi:type IV pilus assembly protein PilO
MEGQSFFEKIESIKMPIRILILVGTVVLLGAAFFMAVYRPKTEAIKTTTNSIADLNRNLTRAKIERKKLPKRRAEKEKVDNQFKEALKLLPNSKDIPNLLKKITELANESHLDYRIFQLRGERPKQFYIEIPIAIEIRGSYHDVAIFFDKVGHMERIMNIHNVSMKPVKPRSTTLVTTCDAVTYRFKGD